MTNQKMKPAIVMQTDFSKDISTCTMEGVCMKVNRYQAGESVNVFHGRDIRLISRSAGTEKKFSTKKTCMQRLLEMWRWAKRWYSRIWHPIFPSVSMREASSKSMDWKTVGCTISR